MMMLSNIVTALNRCTGMEGLYAVAAMSSLTKYFDKLKAGEASLYE